MDVIEHEGTACRKVVRKDMDVIEHEGLFNITLRHKLK